MLIILLWKVANVKLIKLLKPSKKNNIEYLKNSSGERYSC